MNRKIESALKAEMKAALDGGQVSIAGTPISLVGAFDAHFGVA